jgi:outer membrane biosynthesis protein TonB
MHMRAASSVVSLTTHVMVIAAALWATAAHPRPPQPPRIIDVGPGPLIDNEPDAHVPRGPVIGEGAPIPNIPLPQVDGGVAELPRFTFDARYDSGPLFAGTASADGTALLPSLVDELPAMLAGPAAAYPDLLRQAGVHGRVVLEAVIDTLGHVEPGSVLVVESAHPAFVAPAQHSLLASLFRPARVSGRAVRVRVRLAFDFVLRDGRL